MLMVYVIVIICGTPPATPRLITRYVILQHIRTIYGTTSGARGPGDPRHPTQNRLIFYVHLYTNLLFYLFELTCLFRPHADRAGGCGAPAWGITPGCSFLGFPTRSRAGFAPGILCLSALGVPYAGGELAHRGFDPTTCPLFN